MGGIRRALLRGLASLAMALTGLVSFSAVTAAPSSAASKPITIGLICDCTGPLASAGVDVVPVYRAWVDSVNHAGGINGHKIQLIVKDTGANPGTALTEAESLVQQSHVIAIADDSSEDQAFATYLQQHNVPVVGITTSTTPFFTNPDFYPEGQTEDRLFDGIVGAVKKAGGTKMALMYCAEAVQCQEGIAPLKTTAKSYGVSVVSALEVAVSAPNYTAQCLSAKAAGAQVIFTADVQSVDEKIASDCQQQGFNAKYVIDGEILLPSLTKTALGKGTYFTVPNLPYFANTPAIRQMNSAIDKYAKGTRSNSYWGEIAMEAWISGKLFQAAAQAGKLGAHGSTPTSAQLIKGLDSLKGNTLAGLAPPLNFTAGKPHPVDCWYWTVLKGGKYSTPYGLKPACAPGT
ncbi:MAG: ABC transporter substrate-binding protein [Acidimicrobiales bacterium]